MIRVQASVAGYSGSPITLLGAIDEDTGVLVVAKQVPYNEKRIVQKAQDGSEISFVLISNLDLRESEFKFSDELLRDAIRSFYSMNAQGSLDIIESVARYNPDNKIERDTIDERGANYKIMPDIENGQMAVLAMVSFMAKQGEINSLSDFYSALNDDDGYSIITI